MESLMELLQIALKTRTALESGESLRSGLQKYIDRHPTPFNSRIQECIFIWDQTEQNRAHDYFDRHLSKVFFEILLDGLKGHPVHERLVGFEEELIDQIENEIQKRLDALPYLLMIPLLLFMFPAYLLLILGPVLNQFLKNM